MGIGTEREVQKCVQHGHIGIQLKYRSLPTVSSFFSGHREFKEEPMYYGVPAAVLVCKKCCHGYTLAFRTWALVSAKT